MVVKQWNCEPHRHLSEGLTQTDSFTAHKWCETQRIPWFTLSSETPLVLSVFGVETLRDPPMWLSPLDRVVMDCIEKNHEGVTLLELHLFVP
jgi:hypothetical protein